MPKAEVPTKSMSDVAKRSTQHVVVAERTNSQSLATAWLDGGWQPLPIDEITIG